MENLVKFLLFDHFIIYMLASCIVKINLIKMQANLNAISIKLSRFLN